MTPILVFDIETVPDVAGSAPGPTFRAELSDAAVHDWLHAAAEGRRPAAISCRIHLQRVVAIACALRDGAGFKIWSVGESGGRRARAHPPVLRSASTSYTPQLVSWNGGGFDLPVLQLSRADPRRQRGALLGLGRRRSRVQVQQLSRPLSHAASRSHGRACRCTSRARSRRLDAMARLCGFPGKLGMDGSEVAGGRRGEAGSTTSAAIARPT